MSTPTNPFDAMITMTQDWAKAVNPALEGFTPKGFEALWPTMPKEVMETFMGKTFNPEGLDAKTKLLLTLGSLTILGAQAEAAGLRVVENLCPKQEHQRLFGELRKGGFATGVISSKL